MSDIRTLLSKPSAKKRKLDEQPSESGTVLAAVDDSTSTSFSSLLTDTCIEDLPDDAIEDSLESDLINVQVRKSILDVKFEIYYCYITRHSVQQQLMITKYCTMHCNSSISVSM